MTDVEEKRASERASADPAPSPPAAPGPATVWLNTQNWLLMPTKAGHAPLMADMHARNGEHFRMAMPLEPQMSDPSFWTPVLQAHQNANLSGTGVHLVGFYKPAGNAQIACTVDFSGIVHHEFKCCWLGFRMDKSLQGKGLMYDAVAPAIATVFQRHKLHRIMASHLPENERSARLLRRLGFGIDGYARDFMHIGGRWRDNVLTSLISPLD